MVDTRSIQPDTLDDDLTGTLHGFWGFQPLEGPSFRLRSAQQRGRWIVPSKDASALIVGRLDTLNLQSSQAACVENVSIRTAQGTRLDASWKQEKPDELQVGIPLENATPGSVYVLIKKFGNPNVDEVYNSHLRRGGQPGFASTACWRQRWHLEGNAARPGERCGTERPAFRARNALPRSPER